MRRIGDDASDEAVGIEAEVEVDIWKLRYAMAEGLITPNRELELDK